MENQTQFLLICTYYVGYFCDRKACRISSHKQVSNLFCSRHQLVSSNSVLKIAPDPMVWGVSLQGCPRLFRFFSVLLCSISSSWVWTPSEMEVLWPIRQGRSENFFIANSETKMGNQPMTTLGNRNSSICDLSWGRSR